MSVNTVAQLQQIIFVTQYPTIPNDITTAEDFCETFGRYFLHLYLLKKKKNENSTVLLLPYVQWDLFIKYVLKKFKAVISFQSFLFFTHHVSYIENSVSKLLVILFGCLNKFLQCFMACKNRGLAFFMCRRC